MKGPLAQRQAALAAVALLAAVVALAIAFSTRSRPHNLPVPVGSYSALAGSSGVSAFGKRTVCGDLIGPTTEGVGHPVLPCGLRIYLTYRGTTVLTQVIGHTSAVPGAQFDLTASLAKRLGLVGVQPITWSYAQGR